MTTKSYRLFISIELCNIEKIWCTKLYQNYQRHFFAISIIEVFLWLLNDPAWVIRWSNRVHHLVVSIYTISSQFDAPKSRKWSKSSFLAVGIIQIGIFYDIRMIHYDLTRWPNHLNHLVQSKYAISSQFDAPTQENGQSPLIFGYLDHSKRYSYDFWMIQNGRYHTLHVDII